VADVAEISLGGRVWITARARLGGYLALQRAQRALDEAVRSGDNGSITGCLFDYLRTAIPDFQADVFHVAPWQEVTAAYVRVAGLNRLPHADRYAILNAPGVDGKPFHWDYEGRAEVVWIHQIAQAYHWPLAQILGLWPEQAVEFLQEILVDDQKEKEFAHMLSEVAYPYDKATKTSRYHPLERPSWMVIGSPTSAKTRGTTKIHKGFLPIGEIRGQPDQIGR